MKLIRAKIKNFRLLKDLELNFSTDEHRPLTVIRAANESGKTTCEYALMWGLWGEEGLPAKLKNFSIFPNDLANQKGITAQVEIDFLSTPTITGDRKQYRLIRELDINNLAFSKDNLTIFEIKSTGVERLLDTEAKHLMKSFIPLTLKDIYFTDGDRALSFIESHTQAHIKQRRVKEAIRSLLALDSLEATVRHLNNVESKFESEIDNRDYATELNAINNKIEFNQGEIDEITEELHEIEKAKILAEDNRRQTQSRIEEILKQGDKSKLIAEKETLIRQSQNLENSKATALKMLRDLVQEENTSLILIKEKFLKAQDYLRSLKDKKQLPKANTPILEELLTKDHCFCGSSLNPNTPEGAEHIKHIKETIQDSQDADRKTELATSLHFQVVGTNLTTASSNWNDAYDERMHQYSCCLKSVADNEAKIKEKNEIINSIKDDALDTYRILAKKYDEDFINYSSILSGKQAKLEYSEIKIKELNEDREKVQKKLGKNDKNANRVLLSKALKTGFKNILEKLQREEVQRVSNEMNRIFLEMIGSSPDDNDFSSITKAELSSDYEILVYGINGIKIDPDQDLNGASRRAITLAFILALTKVSEVEAPNVIDTPLGMMSGYVKQSVLNQMIKEGSQIILFLTHDEINGVERLIDDFAGTIFTLTNPAHFPLMLENKPSISDIRILRCECNHRETCQLCARIDYREAI